MSARYTGQMDFHPSTEIAGLLAGRKVLALAAMFLCACELTDLKSFQYENWSEAQKASPKGWIPDFLPRSATAIRETRNIETNEQWMRFDFAGTDFSQLKASCPETSRAIEVFPRRPMVLWWPSKLNSNAKEFPPAYVLYQCPDNIWLAIEFPPGRAFLWRR